MKRNNLFVILGLAFGLVACQNDHEPEYVVNSSRHAASFDDPGSGVEYILEKGTENNTFEVYSWSPADYGVAVGLNNSIQLDLYQNDFSSAVCLATTTKNTIRFTVDEINKAIYDLGVSSVEPVRLKMRIVTNAYGGEDGIMLLDSFPSLYSDVLELIVTPCEQPAPEYPTSLYMIGEDFGNWDWESDGVVPMIPVNGKPGQFWCIAYFHGSKGFKWAPQRKWANDFAKLDKMVNISAPDNAVLPSDGLYMIFIDYLKKTIAAEPAKVYGIGDCFGGWNTPVAFQIDGAKASCQLSGNGTIRLYAGSDYSTSDWWTREFTARDGGIVYRADGDEISPAVTANAGDKLMIDFQNRTSSIQ